MELNQPLEFMQNLHDLVAIQGIRLTFAGPLEGKVEWVKACE